MQRSLKHPRLQGSPGTAAVEFALVAPVLILLLVGTLDFGFAYWEKTDLDDAAWAGAVYATEHESLAGVSGAMTSASGLSWVTATVGQPFYGCPNSASQSGVTGITVETSKSATCGSGGSSRTYLTVTATTHYSLILPYPGFTDPMTLTSTATARIQ